MGLETIFWPSPACCSRGRDRILHARHQQSPRSAGMGRKEWAALPGSGEGEGSVRCEFHWGVNFLAPGGSGVAGRSRPAARDDLPFFLPQSYIFVCVGYSRGYESSRSQPATVALQPRSGSPSATL